MRALHFPKYILLLIREISELMGVWVKEMGNLICLLGLCLAIFDSVVPMIISAISISLSPFINFAGLILSPGIPIKCCWQESSAVLFW